MKGIELLVGSSRSLRLSSILGVVFGSCRIEIICLLSKGPMSVTGIADHLELGLTTISHQLMILRRHRLVRVVPQGRTRLYELPPWIRISRRGGVCRIRLATGENRWFILCTNGALA